MRGSNPTLTIFNDPHIGVQRVAGTTKESALALRRYAIDRLRGLLSTATAYSSNVCILGDLFDAFTVPLEDVAQVVAAFREFTSDGSELTLVLGNHDLSTDSTKMGAAQLVAAMVPEVKLVEGKGAWVAEGVWAVPHLRNQEVFDLALNAVPPCNYLLLHCNYDNQFAAQKDHSLNLCEARARELLEDTVGSNILLAHEHQHRTALNGRVVAIGNQFPTSVADCQSNHSGGQGGVKYYASIRDTGLDMVPCWEAKGSFLDVSWDSELTASATAAEFIRVSGIAERDRVVEAMRKVAKLRQTSSAYVVANAVRTPADDGRGGDVATSVEDVRAVDAVDEFLNLLDKREPWMRTAVETYIKDNAK